MERFAPRLIRSLFLVVLMLGTVLVAQPLGLTGGLDRILSDRRADFAIHDVGGDIVLVDIDAYSLSKVGVWPWPRRMHGDLLAAAAALGARRLAFDIDFSTRAVRPEDDRAFADALAASPIETFLAAFAQPAVAGGEAFQVSLPIPELLRHSWPAGVNARADDDVVIRRFPYSVRMDAETVTSLPALLAGRDGTGTFGIDYTIDRTRFVHVSYVDLLERRVPRDVIAGKTLIVGATAVELHDFFPAPGGGSIYGSVILALATETLAQGREITAIAPHPVLPVLFAACLAFLVVPRLRPLTAVGVIVALSVAVEIAAFALAQTLHRDFATASTQILLLVVVASIVEREFGIRRLMLWVRGLEVRNHQAMIDRLVDEGFDAVVVLDDAGDVRRINRSAAAVLGIADDAGLGDLPPALAAAVRRVAQGREGGDARVEIQLTLGDGEERRILDASIATFEVQHAGGRVGRGVSAHFVCIALRDVTERERAYERIRQLALEDHVTGLPNRNALDLHLETRAAADTGLVLVGIDRFRKINERLGHRTGDLVLREISARLVATMGEGTFVARVGADEFAIAVPAAVARDDEAPRRLAAAVAEPIEVSGHRLVLSACIGIALADADHPVTRLLGRAASALRDAKAAGGGSIATFDAAMETVRLKRLAIEFSLSAAIDDGQFEVVYQPQVSLATREIVGVEALVRWMHPTEGLISPVLFIPVAEETGMIHRLGTWVLERACRDAARWPVPISVAVNVSPVQFQAGNLAAIVDTALANSGLTPERLHLEMTESAFVHDGDALRSDFDALTGRGIAFALDDFGTGYSSLSHLTRFPISKIKIDRSFVGDAAENPTSRAVLRSIMALAEGIGAQTIAEGIETEAQGALLADLGCGQGQGWLYSRPVPDARITELLTAQMAPPVALAV